MGEFGRLDWLGNFRVVILYNLLFEVLTAFCLVNKFTASVRKALYEQVHAPAMLVFRRFKPKVKASLWKHGSKSVSNDGNHKEKPRRNLMFDGKRWEWLRSMSSLHIVVWSWSISESWPRLKDITESHNSVGKGAVLPLSCVGLRRNGRRVWFKELFPCGESRQSNLENLKYYEVVFIPARRYQCSQS